MDDSNVQILISDEVLKQYKDTCIQWDPVLRELPFRAASDVLKYFTPVAKLRGKRKLGSLSGNSQFGPFKKDRKSKASVDIDYREIETFHGNVVEYFSPADYIDTPLGYDDPVITEAIRKAGTTLLVLAQNVKARGPHIAQCAFTGVRNADGDATVDICDGLLTIAKKEINAGKISVELGNLYKASEAFNKNNTVDIAKDIIYTSNYFLRRENSILLCPTNFADMYNESYMLSHAAQVYNKQYEQPYVEGSNHKVTIIPMPELDGTGMAILTQKSNLLYGFYNAADATAVDIMREGHYTLSMASDLWLGFQFRTIDPRRLRIIDLNVDNVEFEDEPIVPEQGEQNPEQGEV